MIRIWDNSSDEDATGRHNFIFEENRTDMAFPRPMGERHLWQLIILPDPADTQAAHHHVALCRLLEGQGGEQAVLRPCPDIAQLDPARPVLACLAQAGDGSALDALGELLIWHRKRTAALMVMAGMTSEQRAEMLLRGADEVVDCSISLEELSVRLRNLILQPVWHNGVISLCGMEFHPAERELIWQGRKVHLMPREMDVLLYLARHAGQIISRGQMLADIWHYRCDPGTNIVEVHICRVRSALQKLAPGPAITTCKGQGYRLDIP